MGNLLVSTIIVSCVFILLVGGIVAATIIMGAKLKVHKIFYVIPIGLFLTSFICVYECARCYLNFQETETFLIHELITGCVLVLFMWSIVVISTILAMKLKAPKKFYFLPLVVFLVSFLGIHECANCYLDFQEKAYITYCGEITVVDHSYITLKDKNETGLITPSYVVDVDMEDGDVRVLYSQRSKRLLKIEPID